MVFALVFIFSSHLVKERNLLVNAAEIENNKTN